MFKETRQSGRTLKQLKNAPKNAVFIWCNHYLDYPIKLLHKINRLDIYVVSPSWLEGNSWLGLKITGIILDHATKLSHHQLEHLGYIRRYMRTHKINNDNNLPNEIYDKN